MLSGKIENFNLLGDFCIQSLNSRWHQYIINKITIS